MENEIKLRDGYVYDNPDAHCEDCGCALAEGEEVFLTEDDTYICKKCAEGNYDYQY